MAGHRRSRQLGAARFRHACLRQPVVRVLLSRLCPLLGQAQPALRSQRVESYGNLPPYLHPACRLGQQRNLPERRRSARSGILLPQRQVCRHEQRLQDSRTLQRHFPCPQRRERDCHTGAPLLRRQLSGVPGFLAHQRHRTGHLHVCPAANTPDGLQGGDSPGRRLPQRNPEAESEVCQRNRQRDSVPRKLSFAGQQRQADCPILNPCKLRSDGSGVHPKDNQRTVAVDSRNA